MNKFDFIAASTYDEASAALKESTNGIVLAGGTDIIGTLKEEILEKSPDVLVSLKDVPESSYIVAEEDCIRIGAMTTLTEVAESEEIKARMPFVAEAAVSVASPLIRNVATVGGNLCQDVRCWYYRYPDEIGGKLTCMRKGGCECYAMHGKNQYHSVFGGMKMCGSSACSGKCPAGTDIPRYMEKLRAGDIDGAARVILEVNPIPALTSRVCAHFCQEGCNRNEHDEHVGIGSVERFIGDYILENKEVYYHTPNRSTGKHIALVGSGPAALSAAYFLRKEGHDVTIYERLEEAGGALMYAIPNYRLPKTYVRQIIEAWKDMGVNFVMNTEIGKDIMPEELEAKFDKVFYDTGAWKRPLVGISGEEYAVFGLEFLMEVNKWMTGKVGKEVLVTGGGNVAMDVAITAKRLGASKVTLACLESRDEMPAAKEEIERALEEGIIIMNSWGLGDIITEDGSVKGMKLKKCVSVRDEEGRFNPIYDENEVVTIEAENILMAVGQQVDLSFLGEKYTLELTQRGLLSVDDDFRSTSNENVYAGGDAVSGPSTVIKAVASGHSAANSINRSFGIEKHHECDDYITAPMRTFDPSSATLSKAQVQKQLSVEERSIEKEDMFGLSWEEVQKEANRCMNCGCLAVNPSDLSNVLVAMDAIIKTNKRSIRAQEFLTKTPLINTVLGKDEIVTEIELPDCSDYITSYKKMRLRDSIDFALISTATAFKVENNQIVDARIVLGGAAPVPYRLREVEHFLIGKEITEEVAKEAGELAVKHAIPLKNNEYKIHEIKVYVKRAILELVK